MIFKNSKYPNYHVRKYGPTELRVFRDGNNIPLKPDETCTKSIIYVLSVNGQKERVRLFDFLLGAKPESTLQ